MFVNSYSNYCSSYSRPKINVSNGMNDTDGKVYENLLVKKENISFKGGFFSRLFGLKTNDIQNIEVQKTVSVQTTKPIKSREDILRDVDEAIKYEKEIGFSNLKIFENSNEQEKNRMLRYFEKTGKEKDLLLFATGNKPALIEGIKYLNNDLFDSLNPDKNIRVTEFFKEEKGNLISNEKQVSEVISKHLDLFNTRLGYPQNTSADEVKRKISLSLNSPLRDESKFIDLRMILTGENKYNAYNAQLVEDIKNKYKYNDRLSYHAIRTSGFEQYKQALKDTLYSDYSSYKDMDKAFKDDIARKIDTMKVEKYKNLLEEPINVFEDEDYKKEQLKSLQKMIEKINSAKKYNRQVTID